MKKIGQYLLYLLAAGTAWIAGLLPRGVAFFFAPIVAWFLYWMPQFGKVAVANLAVAFPEKSHAEHRAIARKSFANLFLSLQEFFYLRVHKINLHDWLIETDDSQKVVHDARASGKTAVFLTPHLGNWEIAGITLATYFGFQVATVVRSPRNPWFDKLISRGRSVEGVKIIYSKGAARALVQAHKDGFSTGILIDQNTRIREGGTFVDFCGLPVPVSTLPAFLAKKLDRYIALGTTVRCGRKFRILFQAPPKPASSYESLEELTADLMKITESFVRQYPEQYLWMYKRFQNIPRDASDEVAAKFPPYAKRADDKFYDIRARHNHEQK